MAYKLGSLFDGSGGFPLAGSLCGIEPRRAAEVEPYPIAVTRSRFPAMKHLGDISKVNGAEIEPVDIITFGSPCQDLSVAGKRAGLKHEANGDEETTRSGLFMEAVRIIKEMRRATKGEYPSFALWENVPGAFSSNKGEDFRVVCEELIKIVEPSAVMPSVPKNGWPYADSYIGNGWSLAYRVFDAQYWGVPQRRRRIHLVADLRGERAREVLFEREGVRGYFAEGGTPWQAAPRDAQDCAGADDRAGEGFDRYNQCLRGLDAVVAVDQGGIAVVEPVGFDSYNLCLTGAVGRTVTTASGGLNEHIPVVIEQDGGCVDFGRADTAGCNGKGWNDETCYTLNTIDRHAVAFAVEEPASFYPQMKAESQCFRQDGTSNTIVNGTNPGFQNGVVQPIAIDRAFFNQGQNALYDPQTYEDGTVPTLVARGPAAVCCREEPPIRYIVRRLTPTECARLQGFADRWGDIDEKDSFTPEEFEFWHEVRNTHAAINGKKVQEYTEKQMLTWYNKLHTDSAEYKMWGNGICIFPALYCMQGIVDALEKEVEDDWML